MSSILNSFMDGRKNSKGFMIAEVADNMDTTESYEEGKMIGRLKLSIPGISNEIDKEDLPWAYQMTQTGSGTHDGVGAFRVPAIGTKVICMKIDDQYGWVVLGELNTTKHLLNDYNEDYPETWGMRDKTGNKSVINMVKNYAQFTHMSGTNALIEESGDTTLTVVDNLMVYVTNYGIHTYGEYYTKAVGEYYTKAVGEYYSKTVGDYYTKNVASWGSETYGDTLAITSGGTMTLTAPLIILNGNVIVNGWVHASDDVTAGPVSLMFHTHIMPFIKSGPVSRPTEPPL